MSRLRRNDNGRHHVLHDLAAKHMGSDDHGPIVD